MRRAAIGSVILHGLTAGVLVLASLPRGGEAPPPDEPARIEVIEGSGEPGAAAAQPSQQAAPAQPPSPPGESGPAEPAPTPRPPSAPAAPAADAAEQRPADVRLGAQGSGPQAKLAKDDPRLLHAQANTGNPPPPYPLAAARYGEQGTVTLRIHVAATGAVALVEVVRSSGSPRLDRAAHDQVAYHWRFHPATRNGENVPDIFELNVRFELD
jgi:periplasmic protein TonB